MARLVRCAVLALCAAVLAGPAAPWRLMASPASEAPSPPEADAAAVLERGRVIYEQNCSTCHGEAGEGGFGPGIRPGAKRKDGRPVAEVVKAPRGAMPPLYPVSLGDSDVADVAAFVDSLKHP